MWKTQVQSLIGKYPTTPGATKPKRHNNRACALEPRPQVRSPCALEPTPTMKEATVLRHPCTATREWPPLATARERRGDDQDPAPSKVNN